MEPKEDNHIDPIIPSYGGGGWDPGSGLIYGSKKGIIKTSHDTVDGRNPANQLSLVVHPIDYRVFYIPGGLPRRISEPSTVRIPINHPSAMRNC